MQCRLAPLDEMPHMLIFGNGRIIIQADQREDAPMQRVSGGVNSHFLKEYAVCPDRGTEAAIQDITLKRVRHTMCSF
jgi:hypothetical protein